MKTNPLKRLISWLAVFSMVTGLNISCSNSDDDGPLPPSPTETVVYTVGSELNAAGTTGISVYEGDVYTSGYVKNTSRNPVADYWKNEVIVTLATGQITVMRRTSFSTIERSLYQVMKKVRRGIM